MEHKFYDGDICDLFHLRTDEAVTVVVDTSALADVQDDEGKSVINFSEDDLLTMLASIQKRREQRQLEEDFSKAISA